MFKLIDKLGQTKIVEKITDNLEKGNQLFTGLNDVPRAGVIAGVFFVTEKNTVVFADTQYHADNLASDIAALIGDQQVLLVENEDNLAVATSVASFESGLTRSLALQQLINKDNPKVIIMPISFAKKRLPDKQSLLKLQTTLKVKQEVDVIELRQNLISLGYKKVSAVVAPGEFAIRGGIIDIFPSDAINPIRIDFFGDEIETIKNFDPDTQKSIKDIKEISVIPTSDLVLTDSDLESGSSKLQTAFEKYRETLVGNDKKKLTQYFQPFIEKIQDGKRENEMMLFSEYFFGETTIFDYLENANIFIDEFSKIIETEKIQDTKNAEYQVQRLEEFSSLPEIDNSYSFVSLIKQQKNVIYLSNLQRGFANFKFAQVENVSTRPMEQFFSQIPALKTELEAYTKKGDTVILFAENRERALSIQKTLNDFQINIAITEDLIDKTAQIQIGSLSRGFEIPSENLAVITESELFAKVKTRRPPKRQTFSNAERIASYNELKIDDYVVHVNHGIGQFKGITNLESQGSKQDYLQIAFASDAKIYVPVTQLNLVQKYVGANDGHPRINSLTSGEWAKTKRKISAKIEDIADELIELYAKRAAEVGFSFSNDDDRQRNFDDAFPYVETHDQIQSIKEIKRDMQTEKPMDRLLVGDVGFGKTEVAMRAMFKAVNDKKQVAFLAPTTILAQQHYQTLKDRFADFPEIRIEMMSRFSTTTQNKKTAENAKKHQVDIIVGTHRLLSKDVEFADLGLLVIDEEQRFGVKHKERIKQMRNNVDVLTLTATPIPRTLNMALVGARDLSVLETPPANRFPIQTYVLENNWPVIVDAIEKEMSRSGQTFYVHNRVNDIEHTVAQIQSLIPDARVAYIHGQMQENQVENILADFLEDNYDVLVTTTIIETGVDIPNANTIIVENAQNFGLSSLYQLRGRVGRSNRLAYGYFMYPADKQPNEDAQKRLEAIRDFTELGSGFKLAMRDLSIRGAGDLLGKQQHGFINSVGYELFQEMLTDAVNEKRGHVKKTPQTNAELVISVKAFIPDSYIENQAQKMEMYQRIRQSKTSEQEDEAKADLIDRFGEYPIEVSNLFELVNLKSAADAANVLNIKQNKQEFKITFDKTVTGVLKGERIFTLLNEIEYKARVNANNDQFIVTIISQDDEIKTIKEITKLLKAVYEAVKLDYETR